MKKLMLMMLVIIWAASASADTDISALPTLGSPATATDSVLTYDSSAVVGSRQTNVLFDSNSTTCLTGAGTWVAYQAFNTNLTGINQALDNAANPSFSTINIFGATPLALGTASSNDGAINFKNGTNANTFDITASAFGASLDWILPTAEPAGLDYLLNVDVTTGQMGYTNPASLGGGGGDLVSTNNLSDVTSAATSYGNIKQSGSATATGALELATDAEAVTGTDTARAVTPANLTARLAAPGAIGGTTASPGTFTTVTVDASASPGITALDSGAPGTEKEVGILYWDYIDGGDTTENADFFIQVMQGGTETTVLSFDESADKWTIPTGKTLSVEGLPYDYCVSISDETTALTTGTAKRTFRMPRAMTLTAVRASAVTAPTGATLTIDINETGVTILSTKITLDISEKTSTTAATAPVISDTALADDAEITIDIDQVGSTVAGAGAKVCLIGTVNM